MNEKIFVIAGNNIEGILWRLHDIKKSCTGVPTYGDKITGKTHRNGSDYVMVNQYEQLRGYKEVHGVFVGTWRERKDLDEIMTIILTTNNYFECTPKFLQMILQEQMQ
jgi:hypothetical protein